MYSKGLTLIELLVVISIVLFLFTFGITNYSKFSKRQAVLADANIVKSALQQAQNKAQSGSLVADCDQLLGYQVKSVTGTNPQTLKLSAYCDNNGTKVFKHVKTYSLMKNTQVTNFNLIFQVLFKGMLNGNNLNIMDQKIIRVKRDPLIYQFKVKNPGVIFEGDFQ